jgi:cytochrome c oxidase subunit 3
MIARVAHHFENAEQQFHAANLGMWIFLATEVMFFGGLFAAYAVYRYSYPEAFIYGSRELHLIAGTVNTAVLLLSSFFVALAVHAAYTGRNRATAAFLAGGILMGLVFLGVKVYEYSDKFAHHRVPGPNFSLGHNGEHAAEGAAGDHAAAGKSEHLEETVPPDETLEDHVQVFYSLYFAMTGLHAVHMIIGVVLLGVIAVAALRGSFSHEYYTPVEIGGLYWHFVDVVWVFLFPLLYLIR